MEERKAIWMVEAIYKLKYFILFCRFKKGKRLRAQGKQGILS